MSTPDGTPGPTRLERVVSDVRAGLRAPDPSDGLGLDDVSPRRRSLIERVEESLTIGFFVIMFVVLLIGVFWRYVLNEPLIWTVNVGTVAFIWTVMVGSGLPNWDDDHIQFDLLYDRMSAGFQRAARIIGNIIIVGTFAIAVPATWDYLTFIDPDKVTGTELPFSWAFGGVLIFLVGTVLHRGRILVRDIREVVAARGRRP